LVTQPREHPGKFGWQDVTCIHRDHLPQLHRRPAQMGQLISEANCIARGTEAIVHARPLTRSQTPHAITPPAIPPASLPKRLGRDNRPVGTMRPPDFTSSVIAHPEGSTGRHLSWWRRLDRSVLTEPPSEGLIPLHSSQGNRTVSGGIDGVEVSTCDEQKFDDVAPVEQRCHHNCGLPCIIAQVGISPCGQKEAGDAEMPFECDPHQRAPAGGGAVGVCAVREQQLRRRFETVIAGKDKGCVPFGIGRFDIAPGCEQNWDHVVAAQLGRFEQQFLDTLW
jgi:hypothetical protein